MKIYKSNRKVPVKIDDCVFELVPLTIAQKSEITGKLAGAEKGGIEAVGKAMEATVLALKYSVKGLTGATCEDEDGNEVEYQLEFDESGTLTDECVEDLSNFEGSTKLTQVIMQAVGGGFGKQVRDNDGNPVEGVEVNYKPTLKKVGNAKKQ